jgi:hypothetical protein
MASIPLWDARVPFWNGPSYRMTAIDPPVKKLPPTFALFALQIKEFTPRREG